jgi:hypothetical protein
MPAELSSRRGGVRPAARGGAWVAAQVALLAAILLSALLGLGWPDRLEPFAWVVGGR